MTSLRCRRPSGDRLSLFRPSCFGATVLLFQTNARPGSHVRTSDDGQAWAVHECRAPAGAGADLTSSGQWGVKATLAVAAGPSPGPGRAATRPALQTPPRQAALTD